MQLYNALNGKINVPLQEFGGQPGTGAARGGAVTTIDQLLQQTSALGTGADLAFLIYAEQIRDMDAQVADALKQVQQRSKLRKALNKQAAALRRIKDAIVDHDEKDKQIHANNLEKYYCKQKNISWDSVKHDSAKLKSDPAYAKRRLKFLSEMRQHFGLEYRELGLDANGKIVETGPEQSVVGKGGEITMQAVETRLEAIKDKCQSLDSDREIRMILLNQLLSRKSNAVSQLSSMIKKSHETQAGIINKMV